MPLTQPRRPLLIGLAVLIVLVAVCATIMQSMRPPAEGDDAATTRVREHIAQIGAVPHPVGSVAHDRVRDYLVAELKKSGLTTSLVEGTAANPRLGAPFPIGRVSTVVAELPGDPGAGKVYLDAHYDSVRIGPGSNDDGVAVAGLLEVARELSSGPKLRNTIIFVFTDGEEPGMLGTRHLLESRKPNPANAVVLNLEARGSSGPVIMFETSDGNRGLLHHLSQVDKPLGFSLSYEVYKLLPNDTNFTEWRAAGFSGMNFAYLDGSARYDSGADGLDHVLPGNVAEYTRQNLVLARSLGNADLTKLDQGADTYFWTPAGLVSYPGGLVIPLALLTLLALAALIYLARRRGHLGLRSYAYATLWFLAPLVIAPLLAVGAWMVVLMLRPELSSFLFGDSHGPGWYRAGVVALALAVVGAWFLALRKRFGALSLLSAGLTWLAILGTVAAFAAPGASYLFMLPVLATCVALLTVLSKPHWWPYTLGVAGVVTAAVAVPIIALIFPALGMGMALAPALLIVLLAVPGLPLLDLLIRPGRTAKLTGVIAAALSLVLFGIGVATDPIDAAHPRLSNLAYALDADTGTARWLSADAAPNEWTKKFVAGVAQPMEADLPPITGFFISRYLTGPAESVQLQAPELSTVDSKAEGSGRTVRMRLVSRRGAPVAWLHLASDSPRLVKAFVDGVEVPSTVEGPIPGGKWGWGFGFHALPADGIEVTFTFADNTPVSVRVIDQSDGLAGIPGYVAPPADMRPSVLPSDAVYVARTVRV